MHFLIAAETEEHLFWRKIKSRHVIYVTFIARWRWASWIKANRTFVKRITWLSC